MARFALFLMAATIPLALGGCGRGSGSTVSVAVIGPGLAHPGDPARLVRLATVEGLVGFDEQGRVIPALADRWIVTDDGLSYIFRLRDGTWGDGTAITGDSAREALEAALATNRNTPLGLDLAPIEEVRAMAGRVIEIRLAEQMPDLLQLLAQPELGLVRRNRGTGPMRLTRRGSVLSLNALAPEDRGLPPEEDWKERVRPLHLLVSRGEEAVAAYANGDAEVVTGGRFEDFPRLDAVGVPRGAIRLDPVTGLFGLEVVHADGFLAKPENREALAMAFDRDAIGAALGVGGWVATTRLVAPGLGGDNGTVVERWPGRSVADRQAVAAGRVAAWSGGGRTIAPLRIALPAGPGAGALFAVLAANLKAIGLAARQVGPDDEADLRLVDRVARYPRAAWFFHQLSCTGAHALCDSNADRVALQAAREPDPDKRAELESEAEARLTRSNTFIPFGAPVRWSLVSGDTTGFATNRYAIHPLMPLAVIPR